MGEAFSFGGDFAHKLVKSLLLIKEQGFAPKYAFGADGHGDGRREVHLPRYRLSAHEPEAFTDDHAWMPNVVMIAKNALVWLGQLSKNMAILLSILMIFPMRS